MKNGISRLSGELGTSLNLMNRKEKMILFRKWNIKTKIFYKLIFYFVISLLLFSIVVGGVFSSMFIKPIKFLDMNDINRKKTRVF